MGGAKTHPPNPRTAGLRRENPGTERLKPGASAWWRFNK